MEEGKNSERFINGILTFEKEKKMTAYFLVDIFLKWFMAVVNGQWDITYAEKLMERY